MKTAGRRECRFAAASVFLEREIPQSRAESHNLITVIASGNEPMHTSCRYRSSGPVTDRSSEFASRGTIHAADKPSTGRRVSIHTAVRRGVFAARDEPAIEPSGAAAGVDGRMAYRADRARRGVRPGAGRHGGVRERVDVGMERRSLALPGRRRPLPAIGAPDGLRRGAASHGPFRWEVWNGPSVRRYMGMGRLSLDATARRWSVAAEFSRDGVRLAARGDSALRRLRRCTERRNVGMGR